MKIVKLGLNRMSASGKSVKAKEIVKSMTGNASFPAPMPALTVITTLTVDLDNAILDAAVANGVAKTKTSVVHQKEDLLLSAIGQLANYVENTANGDEAKIKSAGMELKSLPVHAGDLHAPANLVATHGDDEGKIDLHWDSVRGAKSYTIEIASTAIIQGENVETNARMLQTPTAWQHLMVSAKSTVTVKDLIPGIRYYFRVAVIGASGQSAWSELATKIA